MRLFFLSFLILFFTSFLPAQNSAYEWVNTLQGPADDHCLNLDVDNSGNVYVIGRYSDTLRLGPYIIYSNGDRDIFLAKFDKNGTPQWLKGFGGLGYDKGLCISIDSNANVYCTGRFYEEATFDTFTLTGNGHYDAFILKLNSDGVVKWVRNFGGRSHDEGLAITSDISGNTYVTGFFKDTAYAGSQMLTAYYPSTFEIFIVKYNTLGDFQWANKVGGEGSDHGWGIKTSQSGKVVLCGQITDNYTTDGINKTSVSGGQDIFLGVFSITGNLIYAGSAGGLWDDIATDIFLDASDNIYLTGYFNSNMTYFGETVVGNGFNDIFISKHSIGGNLIWVTHAGGNDDDEGEGISLSDDGDIYISGGLEGESFFGNNSVVSVGSYDLYFGKLNPNGDFQWIETVGSPKNEYAFALKYKDKALYIAGYVSDTTYFGNYGVYSAGQADAFIAKIDVKSSNIKDVKTPKSLVIYPNPSSGHINLNVDTDFDPYKIDIMDMEGRMVFEQEFNKGKQSLDLSHLPGGIYIVHAYNHKTSFRDLLILH